MSESTTLTRKPAEPAAVQITDSIGRVLTVKKMTALRELDLLEAAGEASDNRRWMIMATLAACVVEIDGVPVPAANTKAAIRNTVALVGSEGIAAVASHFGTEQPDDDSAVDLAAAKN